MVTLKTRGAKRTFLCDAAGLPAPYSEYSAELVDEAVLWKGTESYDADGFPTLALEWKDDRDDYKPYPRTIKLSKEFAEVPSPAGAAPWARYRVASDTGAVPYAFVERRETVGGAKPVTCGAVMELDVPYEAVYRLYTCNAGGAAAAAAADAPKPAAAPAAAPPTPAPVAVAVAVAAAAPAAQAVEGAAAPASEPASEPAAAPLEVITAAASGARAAGRAAAAAVAAAAAAMLI
jgi:hypothetical protein